MRLRLVLGIAVFPFLCAVLPSVAIAQARTEFTLSNGLRVRLVPLKGEQKLAVILGVKGGFFAEPAGLPHIAHVAEHCIVFGAPEGPDEGKAIDRWFEAGQANAETLASMMYFDLYPAPAELGLALRAQADRLSGAAISPKVLSREIPRALAEVENLERNEKLSTGKFAYSAFVQAALRGQNEVPLKARTRSMTVDSIRDFHHHTFQPDRAVLAIIGDFDPVQVRKAVEAAFGPIARPLADGPEVAPKLKPGQLVSHWDLATRHLVIAWPVPKPAEADHPALTLAALLANQRFFQNRELNELAKMPMASNDVEGLFLINVQAKPGADMKAVERTIMNLISRMGAADGLSDMEVAQACAGFTQMLQPPRLAMFLQSSKLMAHANLELQRLLRELSVGDLDPYLKRAVAVDGVMLRAAIAKYLDPSTATIVRIEPMK